MVIIDNNLDQITLACLNLSKIEEFVLEKIIHVFKVSDFECFSKDYIIGGISTRYTEKEVSSALRKLKKKGLIERDNGMIRLSDKYYSQTWSQTNALSDVDKWL